VVKESAWLNNVRYFYGPFKFLRSCNNENADGQYKKKVKLHLICEINKEMKVYTSLGSASENKNHN